MAAFTKTLSPSARAATRALKQLPEGVRLAAQREMNTTAANVARGAQERVPYRTGTLRKAIAWAARKGKAVVGVTAAGWYWRFPEFGTVQITARPFFRPAALAQERDHQTRIVAALRREADALERASL